LSRDGKSFVHYSTEHKAGETVQYIKALGIPSQEYLDFQEKNKKYWGQKFGNAGIITGDVALTAGAMFFIFKGKSKVDEKREIVVRNDKSYAIAVSPDDIENLKSAYELSRLDFEDSKKQYVTKLLVGIPIIALANGYTFFHFSKAKKNKLEKPVLEERNPLANLRFGINGGLVSNNLQIHFSCTF
jgi:hypothetical protein